MSPLQVKCSLFLFYGTHPAKDRIRIGLSCNYDTIFRKLAQVLLGIGLEMAVIGASGLL